MALHYGRTGRSRQDPVDKLGVFCTNAAVRSPLFNILSEMIGTALCWCGGRRHRLARSLSHRTRAGPCAMAGWQPGVGHRPLARRHHGLRHQPRARSGSAPRSLAAAHSRQGRIELALCADSDHRRPCRRGARGPAAALRASCNSSSCSRTEMWGTQVPFVLSTENFYSRHEATTASAAMAAVSARRMRGPSETAASRWHRRALLPPAPIRLRADRDLKRRHLLPAACIASSIALRSVVVRSCSASTMRVADDGVRANPRTASGAGIVDQRHIGAARLLRGLMHNAAPALGALLRGLRQMLLGAPRNHRRNRATPSSVAFSSAHSMRSNLYTAITSVTGSAGSASVRRSD
jgi:hypothetical protein